MKGCDYNRCKCSFDPKITITGLEKIKPSKMRPLWAATGMGELKFCGIPCFGKWLRQTKIYLR